MNAETAKISADEMSIARQFLESELDRLYRERRTTLVGSVLLVLLVIGYMTWLDRQVAHWTEPRTIALTVSGIFESNIPTMKQSAEALIKTEAPKVAAQIGDTVSREAPKAIRRLVENAVLEYSKQLSDVAIKRYTEAFEAVVVGTLGDIVQVVEIDSEEERKRRIALALEKQFMTALNNIGKGQDGAEDMQKMIDSSHRALVQLNKRLNDVLKKGGAGIHRKGGKKAKAAAATRKDQLTKRFLGAFWRFVQQETR